MSQVSVLPPQFGGLGAVANPGSCASEDAGFLFGVALAAAGSSLTNDHGARNPTGGAHEPLSGASTELVHPEIDDSTALVASPVVSVSAPFAAPATETTNIVSLSSNAGDAIDAARVTVAALSAPSTPTENGQSGGYAASTENASTEPKTESALGLTTSAVVDGDPHAGTEIPPAPGAAPSVPLASQSLIPRPEDAPSSEAIADRTVDLAVRVVAPPSDRGSGEAPPSFRTPVSAETPITPVASSPRITAAGSEAAEPTQPGQILPVTHSTALTGLQPSTSRPAEATELLHGTPRSLSAQVASPVLSIVQRPAGVHQLTMTVNPDSLGPITVRAQISSAGDVQVELFGSSDAGRDALRSIVADLRRDLAAVMPNASLSLGSGGASDASAHDRGAQQRSEGNPGEQPAAGRENSPARQISENADFDNQSAAPRTPFRTHAVPGASLDIFA